MKLYVKLGTHCGRRMIAPKLRLPPKVGQLFEVRELAHGSKPQQVQLDEARDIGGEILYFVSLM